MKNIAYISFIVFVFILSQREAKSQIIDRIQLIETFDDKLKKGEPATFSATFPDTSKSNYQIQAALGFTVIDGARGNLSIIGEWHQNTLIDKEQNTRQLGLNSNILIGNPLDNNFGIDVVVNGKYLNDIKENKGALITAFYFSPLVGSTSSWFGSDNIVPAYKSNEKVANYVQYTYNAYFGFENINYFRAKADSLKGNVSLINLRFVSHLYPLSGYFNDWLGQNQFIDISFDYAYRHDISNSTWESPKERPLLKVGVGLKFSKKLKNSAKKKIEAKVGYEFVNGENILTGLKKQKYQQIALKLKI